VEKWLSENKEGDRGTEEWGTTSLTNLGAFRAYMVEYLRNHRDIDP
jgi:hypothetical protein